MKKRGIGYAAFFYGTGYGNGFPDESRATVELSNLGLFNVYVEVSDVGSGGLSVMHQIAQETLKASGDLVKIIWNDTNLMLDSGTAAASRQTYNTGNAVKIACEKLRDKITEFVGDKRFVSRDEVNEIYRIFVDQNCETRFEGYFKATTSQVNLETGQGNPYWPYTFGVEKAEVIVDTETGKVDVVEIVASFDAGKIVNPVLAEGQIIGGASMGLGYALMEEVIVKNGQIKNPSFTDYIIPTSQDMPSVITYFVEKAEPTGPYGAKGLGEPSMLPTAPAILNAIYDAVGVRITEFPATCERVLQAIKEKEKRDNI